ncbi:PDZ/DHR/GLGF domain protein [Aphelenchoides fujianensis]|nr:PDZ/DHR/GLGF domain protein [Aphelenchoides fujianensis]
MLTCIPPGLLSCKTLKNLDLSKNSITELPKNLGDLGNLTELVLCENKIISIPSSIGSLKKLEMLKISHNCLSTLTPAICSCVELRDLSLCENLLSELPSSIGNLNKLRFFDASSNHLTHVPSTIGGCSSLGVLALRNNKLKAVPMEVGKLEFLKVLDLAENDLTFLPYTLTVLYDRKNLSALWLTLHQPPLPKLVPTFEPTSNIKVLTCCYLPQRDHVGKAPRAPSKSCVVGTRELGRTNDGQTITQDEDAEDRIPIGKFERYDTPHPKPFAPKNRSNRNSGDFSAAAHQQAEGDEPVENRPLRSVLKKRPVSTYSDTQNEETARIAEIMESRKRVLRLTRGPDGSIGWTIAPFNDTLTCVFISHIVPGGAADRAGFRVDDRLLEINGSSLYSVGYDAVVDLIRSARERVRREDRADFGGQHGGHPADPHGQPPRSAGAAAGARADGRGASAALPPAVGAAEPPRSPRAKSSESAASRLSPSVPNIVSLTLKRDRSGSAGFSVSGSGGPNDPVRISELTPRAPPRPPASWRSAIGSFR